MNILITGATGFIGTALLRNLQNENHSISVLTRNKKHIKQSGLKVYESIEYISNDCIFDAIINLAGAPINKRWTKDYKKTLIDSRVNITNSIYNLVKKLDKKPTVIISASAVGYYGNQGDLILDENSKPHDEFTHKLCALWEQEALRSKEFGVNVFIIRLGVVLGINGGILKETVPLFKMGLGGKIGSGKQYISWVHIDDVVEAIKFLLKNNLKGGAYNLTAPFPVTNAFWTEALSKTLKKPCFIPLPTIIVKLIFGEMGKSLLLNGQNVLPERLKASGFRFQYPKLEEAFANIFLKHSKK